MQKVKFRGIPVVPVDKTEYGEWIKDGFVYGYLIGNDVIVGEIIDFEEDYFNTEFWCRVKPETVGQYTGLNDKNNQEIYTGDIVKTYLGNIGLVKCGEYVNEEHVMEYGGYDVMSDDLGGGIRKRVGYFVEHVDGACTGLDNKTDKWIDIIGNVHQNPELLEVK